MWLLSKWNSYKKIRTSAVYQARVESRIENMQEDPEKNVISVIDKPFDYENDKYSYGKWTKGSNLYRTESILQYVAIKETLDFNNIPLSFFYNLLFLVNCVITFCLCWMPMACIIGNTIVFTLKIIIIIRSRQKPVYFKIMDLLATFSMIAVHVFLLMIFIARDDVTILTPESFKFISTLCSYVILLLIVTAILIPLSYFCMPMLKW